MPRAVSVRLETPKKGQIPKKRVKTKLLTSTAPMIKRRSFVIYVLRSSKLKIHGTINHGGFFYIRKIALIVKKSSPLHYYYIPKLTPERDGYMGPVPCPTNRRNLRKSTVRYESATLKGEGRMKGWWLSLRVGNVTEDFQEVSDYVFSEESSWANFWEKPIHTFGRSIAPNWPREFPLGLCSS
jgi:hypothetical protein